MSFEKSITRLNKYSKQVRSSKASKEDRMRAALVIAVEAENIMLGLKGEKRKDCAKLINNANSYLSLTESNVVTASTLEPEAKKLRKRTKTLISSLTSDEKTETAKAVVKKVINENKEFLESGEVTATSLGDSIKKEIREELKNEQNRKIINDLAPNAKKVVLDKKTLATKLFVLSRVPIVLVTNDKPSYFKNVGFEVKELSRYIVLEDQLLVGINTTKVDKREQETLLNKVIESINLSTHEKYRVVGKPLYFNNQTSVIWHWLVPEKTIVQYRKVNNSYFNPKGWGLAFR